MATVGTARNSYDENKFSGIPANFVHKEGDWKTRDFGGPLCKSLDFESTVPESSVSKFAFFGYRSRSTSLSVYLNPELKPREITEIERYLGEGLSATLPGCIYTKGHAQFRRVYSFLTEDNTLVSRKHSDLIRSYQGTAMLSTDEVKLEGGYRADNRSASGFWEKRPDGDWECWQ